MKKKLLLLCVLSCLLVGCAEIDSDETSNKITITNDYYFNKAMIKMADDSVITVDVKKYIVANETSVIICTDDGRRYRVAFTDVTLYMEE